MIQNNAVQSLLLLHKIANTEEWGRVVPSEYIGHVVAFLNASAAQQGGSGHVTQTDTCVNITIPDCPTIPTLAGQSR